MDQETRERRFLVGCMTYISLGIAKNSNLFKHFCKDMALPPAEYKKLLIKNKHVFQYTVYRSLSVGLSIRTYKAFCLLAAGMDIERSGTYVNYVKKINPRPNNRIDYTQKGSRIIGPLLSWSVQV